jgi:putative oxidoreductase
MEFFLHILAYFLIGFYFIFFGFWNIYHWTPITEVMIKKNLPAPFFLLSIAIGLQIIAGFMIISATLVPIAAILLILFTFFIIFVLHPFWDFQGELRKQHMALFITNLTMTLGALLLLLTGTT